MTIKMTVIFCSSHYKYLKFCLFVRGIDSGFLRLCIYVHIGLYVGRAVPPIHSRYTPNFPIRIGGIEG